MVEHGSENWPLPPSFGSDDDARLKSLLAAWREDERKRLNRLAEADHIFQQTLLRSYESDGTQWNGTGDKHVTFKEEIERRHLVVGKSLGEGRFGVVKALTCRSLIMARKKIKARLESLKFVQNEVEIMEKLVHRHFVKLVGTYTWRSKLYILTFPVALCTLETVLDEYEKLQGGIYDIHTSNDVETVARALVGAARSKALLEGGPEGTDDLIIAMGNRLDEILGCLATAVQWMHGQNVRHLDLKPVNIVLNPGEIYITDFGLSRDFEDRTSTETEQYVGHTAGYAAPEIHDSGKYRPSSADIYSVGCIYLHIATVRHGGSRDRCRRILKFTSMSLSSRQAAVDAYLKELWPLSMAAEMRRGNDMGRLPLEFQDLLKAMLADQPSHRPSATVLNDALRMQGQWQQRYHGVCCKKNPHALSLLSHARDIYSGQVDEPPDSIYGYLAVTLYQHEKSAEEEWRLRNDFQRARLIFGEDHHRTFRSMSDLLVCLQTQENYEEALTVGLQMLKRKEELLGNDVADAETLVLMRKTALLTSHCKRYEEAGEMLKRVSLQSEKVFGRDHPETLETIDDLAVVLQSQMKYTEAEEVWRDSLSRKKEAFGKDNFSTLDSMHSLSVVLAAQGNYVEAENLARKALWSRMKIFNENHPDILLSLAHLEGLLVIAGKVQEAEEIRTKFKLQRQIVTGRLLGEGHAYNRYACDRMEELRQLQPPVEYMEDLTPQLIGSVAGDNEGEAREAADQNAGSADILLYEVQEDDASSASSEVLSTIKTPTPIEHTEEAHNRKIASSHMAAAYTASYDPDGNIVQITAMSDSNNIDTKSEHASVENPADLRIEDIEIVTGEHVNGTIGVDEMIDTTVDTEDNWDSEANSLFEEGKFEEAESVYRNVLVLKEEIFGVSSSRTLRTMHYLGNSLYWKGSYEEAKSLLNHTLIRRRVVLGTHHPDTLMTMFGVGNVCYAEGALQAAEDMFRDTVELRRDVLGPEHPDTILAAHHRGFALLAQNRYYEAEDWISKTLELQRRVTGAEHPNTIWGIYNLAFACENNDHGLYGAEPRYREAILLGEKVLGKEHVLTLKSMYGLGSVYLKEKNYWDAERILRRELRTRETLFGKEDARTIESMCRLGTSLWEQDQTLYDSYNRSAILRSKHEEAEALFLEALRLREKVLGKESRQTLSSMYTAAVILKGRGKLRQAEDMYRNTLALRQKVLGMDHPDTVDTRRGLYLVLESLEKDAAEAINQETLESRSPAAHGIDGRPSDLQSDDVNSFTSEIYRNLVLSHVDHGNGQLNEDQREPTEKIVWPGGKIWGNDPSPYTPLDQFSSFKDVKTQQMQQLPKLLTLNEWILENGFNCSNATESTVLEKEIRDYPEKLDYMQERALTLEAHTRYKEAEELHRQILMLRLKLSGEKHPETLESMQFLASVIEKRGLDDEAKILYFKVLELREEVLGKDDPDTLHTLNCLQAQQNKRRSIRGKITSLLRNATSLAELSSMREGWSSMKEREEGSADASRLRWRESELSQ